MRILLLESPIVSMAIHGNREPDYDFKSQQGSLPYWGLLGSVPYLAYCVVLCPRPGDPVDSNMGDPANPRPWWGVDNSEKMYYIRVC